MPKILDHKLDGATLLITVRKDATAADARGDIFAYSSKKTARAHKKPSDHKVGSWASPASEDEQGSGRVPSSVQGSYLIVNELAGGKTWSKELYLVGGSIG